MFLDVLLVLAAYALLGLVAGRVIKQLEFNDQVEIVESCSDCLRKTRDRLEISWCKRHKPDDSLAWPVGIFWVFFLVVGMVWGVGWVIKRIMFPAGRVRSKRGDLLLRELKLKKEEVLVEQRQIEIDKLHKDLGISVPGNGLQRRE